MPARFSGETLTVGEDILRRHGARILHPGDVVVDGADRPASTVYRSGTLLIDDEVFRDPALIQALNQALAPLHMTLLVRPERRRLTDVLEADAPAAPSSRSRVLLRPVADAGPVTVDAWPAVQQIRSVRPDLRDKVALEHLLFGGTIVGAPFTEGSDVGGSPFTEGSSVLSSYASPGTGGRSPLYLAVEPPARIPLCDLPIGRRPVVAVLDTGIGEHPWLPASDTPDDNTFVIPDTEIAQLVADGHQWSLANGVTPVEVIADAWEGQLTTSSLLGMVDTHYGHGTFIAGLVRQLAPNAVVRSIRIMHSDGVVYEGDLLLALGVLADRMLAAQHGGDPAGIVDVVSLSLGYFEENAEDAAFTALPLRALLGALTSCGAIVVASAGNSASRRRFYPAALSTDSVVNANGDVLSVGALNPNGTKALFSNDGDWVNDWDVGAAVVSTFPCTARGALTPHARSYVGHGGGHSGVRETIDIDDFRGGFAAWSGTSFSAPLVAAQLAAALSSGGELTDMSPAAMRDRAEAARTEVRDRQAARAERQRELARRQPDDG
jgi:Subtilase family